MPEEITAEEKMQLREDQVTQIERIAIATEQIERVLVRIAVAMERANAMRPSPIVSPPVFPATTPGSPFPSTYPTTPNWPGTGGPWCQADGSVKTGGPRSGTGGPWCQVPPGAHQRISDDVIDRPEEHPIKSSDLTGPAC